MEFRILGPLEVWDDRGPVELPGAKRRALLTILLIRANQVVSSDLLIEELWAGEPPRSASNALQAAVSRLRKTVGTDRIRLQPPGYLLELDVEELDLSRFERGVAEGRAALDRGEAAGASELLASALALWRGPPLADFVYESFAQGEIIRLEELRLTAQETRIEADLALGRHAVLAGELESLVARHPLREGLRAQLMVALYRSGRQAEALDSYQAGRRAAVEELGIEPTRELRDLEAAILRQDAALDLPVLESQQRTAPVAVPPAGPPLEEEPQAIVRKARKIVTIVFTDVVESTALGEGLDAERLRVVMERFFATASRAVGEHGGRVEKYIGDAVMAVFGVPAVHEDDALRAVRAAAEMQRRLAALGSELERELGGVLEIRTGVNTGEVVVGGGPSSGDVLVTGRAVNLAKRLEEAAGPGEILLSDATYAHVKHAARCDRVEPLALKGIREPLGAWRMLELAPHAPSIQRGSDVPLVGRAAERQSLIGAFERCVAERACSLAVVLGPAGIGKSRLVRDVLSTLADRAQILRGRCLPYGDGITYWPLSEIVRQLGLDRQAIAEILVHDELRELIADRIVAAIGAGGAVGPSEETHWAVRRLAEELAAARPVILVLDDLHWAEPTFLDLVEYLCGFSTGPLLVVCIARDDLLELRPSWAAPGEGQVLLRLGPLLGDEERELISHLLKGDRLPTETTTWIIGASEGNPLFLEQLVASQVEDPGVRSGVPPTIHALLAARIDRLPPAERRVIERASIEGRVFHRGALAQLSPASERSELGASLMALVRRDLIGPARSDYPGDDAFRFRHLLIRDAAYESLPKESRAELHLGFADWLEHASGGTLLEYDEITGYHLEQAYRYRAELGLDDAQRRSALAGRAATRLEAAGRRAFARKDIPAAATLFERVTDLLPAGDPSRAPVLPELGAALTEAGRLSEAAAVLEEAVVAGDERVQAHARVAQLFLHLQAEPERAIAEFEAARELARPLFEEAGDELGLCRLWRLEGLVRWLEGRCIAADEAWQQAVAHARRAGSDEEILDALAWRASEAWAGPTPAPEGIVRCEQIREQVRRNRYADAAVLRPLAALHSMTGSFETALALLGESRATLEDLGVTMHLAASEHEAFVATLAGDHDRAERVLRDSLERLEAMGEKALLSSTAAMLAQALIAQGRDGEALPLVELAEEAGAPADLAAQIELRTARARILARQADLEHAEALIRQAVDLADRTDWLNIRADARLARAAVLAPAGRRDEAAAEVRDAIELYEQKGNVMSARRARALLEDRSVT